MSFPFKSNVTPRKVTLFCPFGGGGGGALGGQRARAELFGRAAVVELLGGIDNEPRACADFEYLTGVPESCLDVAKMTVEDLRRICPHVPDIVFSSPPCKASSKLLPAKRSREPKYQAMSDLALVMTRLLLSAWDSPPPLLVYENVPNITSRARAMLAELRRILRAAGYSIQDGFHDCGEVGGLGQRRKRWFFVARLERVLPFFLYKPPNRGVQPCWSVLSKLPAPGDPSGGPMHELPAISAINYARLWAIPAGGDWRDLRGDATPRRRARWKPRSTGPLPFEPTGMLVQIGADGTAPDAALTTNTQLRGRWGVLDPEEPAGTVIGNARVNTGPFSIADERAPLGMKVDPSRHTNHYVVTPATEPARCITGATRPGNGALSVAAPLTSLQPELVPQAGNDGLHYGKYQVLDPAEPAPTVTGATRVGSGAPSIASVLLPARPAFDRAYSVLNPEEPSPTIATQTSVGCGGYAIPSSVLPLKCEPRSGAYGVLDPEQPSKTVVGAMKVDNSPAAVASRALPPGYGVLSCEEARRIATGEIRAPFMVVDRSDPTTEIAIVDRLDRPAYRWEVLPPLRKGSKPRRRRVNVPLVMLSADGTWHRPLTTLELSSLQGFPWMHNGKPLVLSGGSTKQRETVGNAVPPPTAQAIIEQMLLCLLAADAGCFYLDSGGQGVWCKPETRRQLEREGIRIVHGRKPWNIGGRRVLDDGHVMKAKTRTKRAPVLAKKTARPRPLRLEALM